LTGRIITCSSRCFIKSPQRPCRPPTSRRRSLSRQANTEVILGTVTGIDVVGRAVLIGERRIPYDQLVIATGARILFRSR
jgi:NADH dehydrogenase FAD-containing subunit